jgi:tetratricopeptide (TPR) repeat protein
MNTSKIRRAKRSTIHSAPTASGLHDALGQVADIIGRMSELLEDPQGSPLPRDIDLSGEASRALDRLEAEIAAAWALVSNRAAHVEWDAAYSEDGWPERARRLADAIERDRDVGTATWFEAWLTAMGQGAQEEATRILALDVRLADWGLWLPDRAAAVQVAIGLATLDPVGAATLVGNLADVLVDYEAATTAHPAYALLDRLAQDPSYGRGILLIVIARLLALGGDARSAALLDRARLLVGGVQGEVEASLSRAISTTESFLFRHKIIAESEARVEAIRGGAVADLFAIHEFIELRRAAEPVPSSPVPGGGGGDPALVEVQQLVDGLKSIAGSVERLDMLLEPPSPVLVLALATRLAEEEQFARAERLLARLWEGDLPLELRLPAAAVAVTLAEAEGRPPDELAAILASAGDRALWASHPLEARSYYERSLELRPDNPDTLRSLADALQVGAWGKERTEAVADLNRALALTHRAAEISPIGEGELWAYSLTRSIYHALYRTEPSPHEDYPWRALGATIAALADGDSSITRLRELVLDLIDVGLFHTSAAFAELLSEHIGSSPDEMRNQIYALLSAGRPGQALALINALEPRDGEDPGWIDGLRGLARSALGDRDAEVDFERALQVGGLLIYRIWLAEHRTRQGDATAGEQWSIVWKESDLGDANGATSAAWAAVYRGALVSASRIVDALARAERLVMGAQSGDMAKAFVRILQSDGDDGWAELEGRLSRILDSTSLELARLFLRELFLRARTPRPALARQLDAMTERLKATLHPPSLDGHRFAMAQVELKRTVELIDDDIVRESVAELQVAIDGLEERLREVDSTTDGSSRVDTPGLPGTAPIEADSIQEDSSSAEAGADAAAPEVVVEMPPSWFAEWQGRELSHEFFVRGVPLARAALMREGVLELASRRVHVRTNEAREPDAIGVFLAAGIDVISGFVGWKQWYCPEEWIPALREGRRHKPSPWPGIHTVSPPRDATDRITSWSGPETVARMIFRVIRAAEEKQDASWRAPRSSSG